MIGWFAGAIGAGESKNGVALDYLRYLAGENYREKATEWFENYYGTRAYKPPGPGGLIEDWGTRMSDLEVAHTTNADRIRLAKDALISTGYFTPEQVADDIAPRIIELNSALEAQESEVSGLRDRAITAERKLEYLKKAIADA